MASELRIALSLGPYPYIANATKNVGFILDEDTMRDLIIHWREREYAEIEMTAGHGFTAMELMERQRKRRHFIEHLGGMIAERIGMLLEAIEDDKRT